MKQMCLELVEVFGDKTFELGDDSTTRMKQAMQFLLMAITLNNQQRKIESGVVELSADPSFASAALSEDLSTLLNNAYLSSMTPALPSSDPAAEQAAKEAAEAAGKNAKGKAPAKGAPTSSATPTALTGRDAMFLLSSLCRERNTLFVDNLANDLSYDLHLMLKKTFAVYDQQCCVKNPPALNDTPTVPASTVSTSWKSVATPADWKNVKQGSQDSSNSVNKDDGEGMDLVYGLYSHAAVFFLLGDATAAAAAAAAPAKGGKPDPNAAAAPATSVNPILTKVVLYRSDVRKIEKGLRVLRQDFSLHEAAGPSHPTYKGFAAQYASLVYGVYQLLHHGYIPSDLMTAEQWNDQTLSLADGGIKISIDKVSIALPFGHKVLTNLANIFTTQRDMLYVQDLEVCKFVRYSLGYSTQ